jgi:cytochrome c556
MKKLALAIVAIGISSSAVAQMKPEDALRYRQAGYSFMEWNLLKIKAQVEGPADKFDKAVVLNSALGIKGVANSGMGALYFPGTDKAVGSRKTRAKPELFDPKNADERNKIGKNFFDQANKLAEVAAGGDQKAIGAQFGELAKACKACHDKFRLDEEKK